MMQPNVYIYPGSDHVFQALLDDARGVEGIRIENFMFDDANIERKILKDKRKHKIIWNLFGQKILQRYISHTIGLNEIPVGSIVVFSNISARFLPVSFLKHLKQKGIKLVIYFIDSISNVNSKEAFNYVNAGLFDKVLTFDKGDSQRYGFVHFYTMYSRHYGFPVQLKTSYDAIYVGSNKGRYEILKEIKKKCSKSKLFVNMLNIIDEQKTSAGFQSNVSISYVDSLKLVQNANCIIDIVLDPAQSGLSLRTYEAIAFNKKLITNNKSILSFPFYNPKYMFCFEKIEDINEDFLKERIKVDYGYNDEYSPLAFVEKIRKMFSYDPKKCNN